MSALYHPGLILRNGVCMPVVSRSAVYVLLRPLTLPAGEPCGGASVRVPYMFTYLCTGCSVGCGGGWVSWVLVGFAWVAPEPSEGWKLGFPVLGLTPPKISMVGSKYTYPYM